MNNFLEIIINNDSVSFGNWIENYQPESGEEVFLVKEINEPDLTKNEQEIVFDDVYLRICGTPKKEIISGAEQYKISTISGPKALIENRKGFQKDYPILTAINLDKNFTKLIINTNQKKIEPYIQEMVRKIQEIWPESRRYLLNKRRSPYPFKDNPLIFDLIIKEVKPNDFLKWLKPILERLVASKNILLQNEHIYESNYFGIEIFTPNKFADSYELYCLLETKDNLRNTDTGKISVIGKIPEWLLLHIDIKPISDDKYYLRGYLYSDDPYFHSLAEELETRIRISYPTKISEVNNKDVEKQENKREKENNEAHINKKDVYVPKKQLPLSKWKAIWKIIKDDWKEYADFNKCLALIGEHPHLVYSNYTIRQIIIAGESGLLDEN